jgi:hypothetical protein
LLVEHLILSSNNIYIYIYIYIYKVVDNNNTGYRNTIMDFLGYLGGDSHGFFFINQFQLWKKLDSMVFFTMENQINVHG